MDSLLVYNPNPKTVVGLLVSKFQSAGITISRDLGNRLTYFSQCESYGYQEPRTATVLTSRRYFVHWYTPFRTRQIWTIFRL